MADYISREEAEKRLNRLEREAHHNSVLWPDHVEECREAIREIPAADVRPVVRARWEDETGYIFNLLAQRVYCPACKSYAYFYPITAKNYCPNCGAYMRETGR